MAFKSIWHKLVVTRHDPYLAQPFFHMRSEGFWDLCAYPGYELWLSAQKQLKSLNQLNQFIHYAQIDSELALLLAEPSSRSLLREVLLETEAFRQNSGGV